MVKDWSFIHTQQFNQNRFYSSITDSTNIGMLLVYHMLYLALKMYTQMYLVVKKKKTWEVLGEYRIQGTREK